MNMASIQAKIRMESLPGDTLNWSQDSPLRPMLGLLAPKLVRASLPPKPKFGPELVGSAEAKRRPSMVEAVM
jgi:hypothetical protein